MRIAIGSDHAGFELKKRMVDCVRELEHQVVDLGTNNTDAVDYPDYMEAVDLALLEGQAERGIAISGTVVGASVAANKSPGIRAGLCHNIYSPHQGVEHDDLNVLVMGTRVIGLELTKALVGGFLDAEFRVEARHRRRLEKIGTLEVRYSDGGTIAREGT